MVKRSSLGQVLDDILDMLCHVSYSLTGTNPQPGTSARTIFPGSGFGTRVWKGVGQGPGDDAFQLDGLEKGGAL